MRSHAHYKYNVKLSIITSFEQREGMLQGEIELSVLEVHVIAVCLQVT